MQRLISNVEVRRTRAQSYLVIKRLFDLGTSLLLIICLSPFLFIFSIAILLFSGRPIFFKQKRTGMDNIPFSIWKFRTMKKSANGKSKHHYDWENGVPNEFIFKTASNQQVTRIGKLFRKFSIDETPQLLNVLLGNMSIVGPRPEIPEISRHYNEKQRKRLDVKPGITGYAQINGRSEINHGKKMELDQYYVENCSFIFDVKILVRTLGAVIRGKGAF